MKKIILYLILIFCTVAGYSQAPDKGNTVTKKLYTAELVGIDTSSFPWVVDKTVKVDTFVFQDGTKLYSVSGINPDSSIYVTYNGLTYILDSLDNIANKRTSINYNNEYAIDLKVWTDDNFQTYQTNFNWNYLDSINTITGSTLYFSPSGFDSLVRGGTPTRPLKTLSYAYANFPTATVYQLLEGYYEYEHGFQDASINRNLSIKKYGSGSVFLTNRYYPTVTKKAENVNIYKFYTTDTSVAMIDTTVKDSLGYFKPLYKVNKDLSLLDASPGSYYWSGDTVYLHRFNDSAYSNSLFVERSIATIRSDANTNIYLEGMNIWGGSQVLVFRNEDTLKTKFATVKDCNAGYSALDGCGALGNTQVYYNNVTSVYTDDNFDLTGAYTNNARPRISPTGLEYYVQSYFSSNRIKSSNTTTSFSANASTSHYRSRIMRIGGIYGKAQGPNVADISACVSINIGCRTFGGIGSQITEGVIGIGFECGSINIPSANEQAIYPEGINGTYINCTATDSIGLYVRNSVAELYNYSGSILQPAGTSVPPSEILYNYSPRKTEVLTKDSIGDKQLAPVAWDGNYNSLRNLPTLNSGTVTSITAGYGLTGGTITTSGTITPDTTIPIRTYFAGSASNPSFKFNRHGLYDESNAYARLSINGSAAAYLFNFSSIEGTTGTRASISFSPPSTSNAQFRVSGDANTGASGDNAEGFYIQNNGVVSQYWNSDATTTIVNTPLGGLSDSLLVKDDTTGKTKKIPTSLFLTGYSGTHSQVGAATTVFTVTIGSTMSNTNYKVFVTPTNALSSPLFYVTNKTTTTFDVQYISGLTGTVEFDWQVVR